MGKTTLTAMLFTLVSVDEKAFYPADFSQTPAPKAL